MSRVLNLSGDLERLEDLQEAKVPDFAINLGDIFSSIVYPGDLGASFDLTRP